MSSCQHDVKIKRSPEEKKLLSNRLNRIEGQIRGIKAMVESDAYCMDIINQSAAANAAINSFLKELLATHIKSCVKEDIILGNDEKLTELCSALKKLMK